MSLEARRGELLAVLGPERRRQDDAALDPRRHHQARLGRDQALERRGRLGAAAGGPLPAAHRRGEPAPLRSHGGARRRRGDRRADARADRPRGPPPRPGLLALGREPAARSTSRSGCSATPRCCCSTSPARASTRASGCGSGSSSPVWRRAGRPSIYSTHQIEEASHYGDRLVVLADGETIFDGSFAQMRRAAAPRPKGQPPTAEYDFVRFLRRSGH